MNAPARQSSDAIAPDTTGQNFFRADQSLQDLLQIHLPAKVYRHIEPHLDRLGALAGDHLDASALVLLDEGVDKGEVKAAITAALTDHPDAKILDQ